MSFEDSLDAWITSGRYRSTKIQVWCQNPDCETYDEEPIDVVAHTEYGTTWWEPDECPFCDGTLEEFRPET